jgi:hypothetical protein
MRKLSFGKIKVSGRGCAAEKSIENYLWEKWVLSKLQCDN